MGFRFDNSGVGGAIANFSPDFVGTLAAPVVVTSTGLNIMSNINQSFFVTAYITSASDVDVTANPQISAGYAEGQRLTVWYIGSFSVLFEDGNGLSLNGPRVCNAGFKLELQWDGVSTWNEITTNQ